MLAGLGYWVAGVKGPVLLGSLTAFLALFPFGAPLVWVPAAIWLWSGGHVIAAVGLGLWGLLIVGTADNVIRPWVISGATKVPFLFVFFGVVGGVLAFGLIGLFIGPVLLSVLMTLWRESAAALETAETESDA
jgi:predicted PurR-regulated permease PerM